MSGRPESPRVTVAPAPNQAARELAEMVREAISIETAATLIECYARTAAIEAVGRYQEHS